MGAQQQAKGGGGRGRFFRGETPFRSKSRWWCGGPERPFALQLGAVPDPDASVSAC